MNGRYHVIRAKRNNVGDITDLTIQECGAESETGCLACDLGDVPATIDEVASTPSNERIG